MTSNTEPHYQEYVTDKKFHESYTNYQKRYAEEPAERDKITIKIVAELFKNSGKKTFSLLDIGCHTGNLLYHLKKNIPQISYTGGDLPEEVIGDCKANPMLDGIDFQVMDVCTLPVEKKFDVITINAVLYLFSENEFESALKSIAGALAPGGHLICFDFFHPYNQDLKIIEKSNSHPAGLHLHFRPYSNVREMLRSAGFAEETFSPFEIPIDLEKNAPFGDNKDGLEDLNSYTVKSDSGKRMLFRGTLYQPWCHLVAQKGSS